jgi:hypothetical protein
LSIDAAPDFFSSATCAMRTRFFLGGVTFSPFHSGLGPGDFDDFSINATPLISSSFSAGFARFLFRSEPFATVSLALFNGCLTDLSVFAAPNGLMVRTIPPRLLFGRVTPEFTRLCIRRAQLDNISVDADPTKRRSATSFGFLLRIVALTTLRLAIRLGRLEGERFESCFDAAPTLLVAGGSRVGFGSVPMTTPLVAIRLRHRDDTHAGGCVNAAPTHRRLVATIIGCFFGIVALTMLRLAIRLGRMNDDPLPGFGIVEAAPTLLAIGVRF